MAYRIHHWDRLFENSESRKLKSLKWVAVPNRMNTQGYTALLDHEHGAAHFGAWCAIVEICSTREPRELRGVLPESDGSIGGISRALGRISRIPASVFEELLPRLIDDHDIQWIEWFADESGKSPETSGKSPSISRTSGEEQKGREQKGRGGEDTHTEIRALATLPGGDLPSAAFDAWWALWSAVRGTNHRLNAEGVFPREVTARAEQACMECTASYLQSLSDITRGYNPENFLIEQARDKFKARWPARSSANGTNRKPSVSENVERVIQQNLATKGKPW